MSILDDARYNSIGKKAERRNFEISAVKRAEPDIQRNTLLKHAPQIERDAVNRFTSELMAESNRRRNNNQFVSNGNGLSNLKGY